jgi:hypothetical protein
MAMLDGVVSTDSFAVTYSDSGVPEESASEGVGAEEPRLSLSGVGRAEVGEAALSLAVGVPGVRDVGERLGDEGDAVVGGSIPEGVARLAVGVLGDAMGE